MSRIKRTITFAALLGAAIPACLSRPIESLDPVNSAVITEALTQSKVDKIDIVLAIDDSGSMEDKQAILAVAVPDLVEALVNPGCFDADGALVVVPDTPLADCPDGSRREFDPVLDIHIGVLSSSLGGRGSPWGSCHDDGGRLVDRIEDGTQDTYQGMGFLVWEPEAEGDEVGLYKDAARLNEDLGKVVLGVGQTGCGHEAQLESWYRFLIDPDPYATITLDGNRAVASGTDQDLLKQREEFVRPDSLVAIIMLSDENDCSFRADSYGYFTTANAAGRGIMDLVPRSECAADANDPCCAPCGFAPEQCKADPQCDTAQVAEEERLLNLTCFDQKRRYGIDLLYPTSRYVDGLTQLEVEDRRGEIHPNPLLVSKDGLQRGKDRVFLAGIVGVPWQLLARDPSDLTKGFQSNKERIANGVWGNILGDPSKGVAPKDAHMIESIHARAGLPDPSAGPGADPYNGHEYEPNTNVAGGAIGDLQYACTFELPDPIVCNSDFSNCDCKPNHSSNTPLCQANDGSYGTTQYRAKAYPGRRQLSVLKDLGGQGIIGSICPAQLAKPAARDYGYLPAIGAIIERLKQELGGPCLSRSLKPNAKNQVGCIVLEGQELASADACNCDYAQGRTDVAPEHRQAVVEAMSSSSSSGLNCFCEIEQLEGAPLDACQMSLDDEPRVDGELVNGWCYIDVTTDRPLGNEELVKHCEKSEQRAIRFVNEGEPMNDAHVFITCQQ